VCWPPHEGSNAQAVIDACASGRIDGGTVVVVISNNSASGALARARTAGIVTAHLSGVTHADPEELDGAIAATLLRHGTDLVVLAGYMRKLGPCTLAAFDERILNVHPALLPKFGGVGMYGTRVHEAVLAARASVSGATVHFVDSEYDHGAVLAQREAAVRPDDPVTSLAARVLRIEHELLVAVLADVANGSFQLPPVLH
jgi:phosphoribosylglycinamide formyltransferase 1